MTGIGRSVCTIECRLCRREPTSSADGGPWQLSPTFLPFEVQDSIRVSCLTFRRSNRGSFVGDC
jgi:hypothetical protein